MSPSHGYHILIFFDFDDVPRTGYLLSVSSHFAANSVMSSLARHSHDFPYCLLHQVDFSDAMVLRITNHQTQFLTFRVHKLTQALRMVELTLLESSVLKALSSGSHDFQTFPSAHIHDYQAIVRGIRYY